MASAKIEPVRVAVFGSYYQGKAVIDELLSLQAHYPAAISLVGIATDDPLSPRVSPQRRIWRFATQNEYGMIPEIANQNAIPVWSGSIKGDDFFEQFAEKWKPDICYMATFGQRVPERVFDIPRLGFFNFHPAVDREWPSYTGGDPFGGMIAAREPFCSLAMHAIDEEFDHGPLVAFSERVHIGAEDTILSMYKKTSLSTAEMVRWHLGSLRIVAPHESYQPKAAPLLAQKLKNL